MTGSAILGVLNHNTLLFIAITKSGHRCDCQTFYALFFYVCIYNAVCVMLLHISHIGLQHRSCGFDTKVYNMRKLM